MGGADAILERAVKDFAKGDSASSRKR